MTPYTKKELKETKSSFLKDHSKNMIMDGTCHIVEDNMAKDKIFFCHKSIQIWPTILHENVDLIWTW